MSQVPVYLPERERTADALSLTVVHLVRFTKGTTLRTLPRRGCTPQTKGNVSADLPSRGLPREANNAETLVEAARVREARGFGNTAFHLE